MRVQGRSLQGRPRVTQGSLDVTLTNRWAVFHSPYDRDALDPFFRYRHPSAYWAMRQAHNRGWDGYIRFLRNSRVPAGLFLAQRDHLAEQFDLTVHDRRTSVRFDSPVLSNRPFQNECLVRMFKASNLGGLILNSTGTGKTRIAALYFKVMHGSGCFLVDELTLLDQARAAIAEVLGEPVGIVGASQFRPQRITVATVQTMHRHRNDPQFRVWTRGLKVLFVDELHLALNRRNLVTVQSISPLVVFGLTATLSLQKADIRLRAFALAGPVIYEYPYRRGVEEQYLTPGVVVAVDLNRDIQGIEYAEAYDRFVVRSRRRNNVIEAITRKVLNLGKHVIVFAERIAHLKFLSKRVSDIPHRVVCGEKSRQFRSRVKRSFEASRVRLIITNRVFKKGVDIARVDAMIDGASYRSKEDAVQKFGRGVRLCEGKRGLIYFDIGDCGTGPFVRAAKSRRSAFRKAGIPVFKFLWRGDVEDLFRFAEKKLESVLKKSPVSKTEK